MPDAGLDSTRRVGVPPGAGVPQLVVPGMTVGVFINCRCAADGVEVTL